MGKVTTGPEWEPAGRHAHASTIDHSVVNCTAWHRCHLHSFIHFCVFFHDLLNRYNRSLVFLDLRGNPLSQKCGFMIRFAISQNDSLCFFHLAGSRLSAEHRRGIEECVHNTRMRMWGHSTGASPGGGDADDLGMMMMNPAEPRLAGSRQTDKAKSLLPSPVRTAVRAIKTHSVMWPQVPLGYCARFDPGAGTPMAHDGDDDDDDDVDVLDVTDDNLEVAGIGIGPSRAAKSSAVSRASTVPSEDGDGDGDDEQGGGDPRAGGSQQQRRCSFPKVDEDDTVPSETALPGATADSLPGKSSEWPRITASTSIEKFNSATNLKAAQRAAAAKAAASSQWEHPEGTNLFCLCLRACARVHCVLCCFGFIYFYYYYFRVLTMYRKPFV